MNQAKPVDFLLPVPTLILFKSRSRGSWKLCWATKSLRLSDDKSQPKRSWNRLQVRFCFWGHLPLSPNSTWKSSTGAQISTFISRHFKSHWLVVARWMWMWWMCVVALWRHDNRGEKTQHPIWVRSLPNTQFCCKCQENIYTMNNEKTRLNQKSLWDWDNNISLSICFYLKTIIFITITTIIIGYYHHHY